MSAKKTEKQRVSLTAGPKQWKHNGAADDLVEKGSLSRSY